MPRGKRRPPTPKPSGMPRSVSPAVAALGVGIRPDKWETPTVIASMERRYLQLVQLAEECTSVGRKVKARLYHAGAFELTLILASYHQENSDPEVFEKWDMRKHQEQARAYQIRNRIVEGLGAGTDAPSASEDEA
jgi:hypothetical protein